MVSLHAASYYDPDRIFRPRHHHDGDRSDMMELLASHMTSQQFAGRPASKTVTCCPADGVAENNWQKCHPSKWTAGDVLDLIYFVASTSTCIDAKLLSGEKFQNIDGHRLPLMTRQDFVDRDPRYGDLLYDTVRDLLDKSRFTPPDDSLFDVIEEKPEMDDVKRVAPPRGPDVSRRLQLPKPVEELMMDADVTDEPVRRYAYDDDDIQPLSLVRRHGNDDVIRRHHHHPDAVVRILGHAYDIDSAADFHSVLQPRSETVSPWDRFQSPDVVRPVYTDLSNPSHVTTQLPIDLRTARAPQPQHPVTWSTSHPGDWARLVPDAETEYTIDGDTSVVTSLSKRKCHGGSATKRPSNKKSRHVQREGQSSPTGDRYDSNDDVGVTSGGRHLWEFIRDLLKAGDRHSGGTGTVLVPGVGQDSPKHVATDSIIRWENRDDGVFRIIDSKTVALLWGRRKHNQTMTYEKLSRALRWCRKNNFFAALPKDGGYPKKLCFKFGPLANNWKDT